MTHITLNHIAKIEGHAKLNVKITEGKVEECKMEVFEGSRYFEAIVKDRHYSDLPIITARICGICSQAHAISSIEAIENAFGVKASNQTKLLREVMCIASLIQSHVLHLYFLALPDYLGYDGALSMAAKHKKEVVRGLKLKKLANDINTVIGGRDVHAITCVVGGFTKIPKDEQIKELVDRLKDAKNDAIETAKLFAKIKYPKFERRTEFFAMVKPKDYTVLNGGIASSKSKVSTKDYAKHLREYIVPYSTAKFSVYKEKPYLVGALARVNLNRKNLSYNAKKALKLKTPCYNPFMNNLCQAVEVVHFIECLTKMLEEVKLKEEEIVGVKPKSSRGISVSEAPRGLLFHDYTFDSKGFVKTANIVTPTAQNLKNIEEDIKEFLPSILKKKESEIVLELEKLIRAYDPCISCSAHFLEVNWL